MTKSNVVVAILNKNCATSLHHCLESLINQTFKNFVVVAVDGNSSDESLQVLREYSKRDDRVHFFLQKSDGTGIARNELVEYVREHFPGTKAIVWGDAENVYDQDYLANLLTVQGDVVGGVNIIDSDSPLSQSLWWYYNGFDGRGVLGNNEVVQFSLYKRYNYLPVIRDDDFFFHEKILRNGVRLQKASKAICYIKTVDSLSKFLKWEKVKVKGLWEGIHHEGGSIKSGFLLNYYFLCTCLARIKKSGIYLISI